MGLLVELYWIFISISIVKLASVSNVLIVSIEIII